MSFRSQLLALFTLFLLGCSGSSETPGETIDDIPGPFEPENVLFIGNSHTRYNSGVDFHLSGFVTGANLDYTTTIEKQTSDGATLRDHLESETTMSKIREKEWDVIVLQENTSVAALDPTEAILAIQELRFAIPSGTKIYLFMTWAYQGDPLMLADIKATYERASPLVSGTIVPVGQAFDEIRKDPASGITLYDGDGIHPSPEGTYLASAMFFVAIYGEDPREMPYTGGIEAMQSDYLRNKAFEVWTSYQN